MSQQHPPFQQQPFQPAPQPPKKHTARNVIIGITVGIFLVIGGCTAIIGGALSSVDTTPPGEVARSVDTGPSPDPIITPTNKPSVPKTTAPKATQPSLTKSQEQAIGAAESYLEFTAFSRKGLIRQLSSGAGDAFSVADATFAVDHIKVNWNEQAAKAAKSYLEMTSFSRQGLIRQLESSAGDGFTHAQAVYGVTKAGL